MPTLFDKAKFTELMYLNSYPTMGYSRIELTICSIINCSHFSNKDKCQFLLICQVERSILCQPLHIFLAEEMMEQKSCRKLIGFMVRLKGRWHQACLLHQSAHSPDTCSFRLCQVGIMENLTDSWIAKHRTRLAPIIR